MEDTRLVPLAALQHYAYCPRQCALIHLEQAWAENWFTAQGQQLHQRVDAGKPETRRGVRFERGVLVNSEKLKLTGKLDLLEIDTSTGRHCPVEYKRGKPKTESWDRIQLCAQALCLEEMLDLTIEEGALWYWQTRHREPVVLDAALREQTLAVIDAVHEQFASGITPSKPAPPKRCRACSLREICQPQWLRGDHSADYVQHIYQPAGSAEPDEEAVE